MIIRRAKVALDWRPKCHTEVEVIRLDGGRLANPLTAEQIREWIGTGRLHFWQTADGPAQICIASLLHCIELEDVRHSHSESTILAKLSARQVVLHCGSAARVREMGSTQCSRKEMAGPSISGTLGDASNTMFNYRGQHQ